MLAQLFSEEKAAKGHLSAPAHAVYLRLLASAGSGGFPYQPAYISPELISSFQVPLPIAADQPSTQKVESPVISLGDSSRSSRDLPRRREVERVIIGVPNEFTNRTPPYQALELICLILLHISERNEEDRAKFKITTAERRVVEATSALDRACAVIATYPELVAVPGALALLQLSFGGDGPSPGQLAWLIATGLQERQRLSEMQYGVSLN